MSAAEPTSWRAGENTHERLIYTCLGGMSNTGITAGLAALAVVDELGLDKVAIGCLAALPLGVPSVLAKTAAALGVVTLDGCPNECARKLVEAAGYAPISLVLTRDIGMRKVPFHEVMREGRSMMSYISEDEVQ